MSDKRNVSIKRSGELMLSGWRLLAIHCPVCRTALLGKGEDIRCTYCDLPVRIASSETSTIGPEISPPSMESVKEKPVPSTATVQQSTNSERRQRLNQTSQRIGEKLLQGWTMLAQECPTSGSPLMRRSSDQPALCVCCDCEFDITSSGEVRPHRDTETAVINQVDDQSSEDEEEMLFDDDKPILDLSRFARQESSGDSSWKISQQLLRGCALLDTTCPLAKQCDGNVPLLRHPSTGKKFCVECGDIDVASGEKHTAGAAMNNEFHQRPSALVNEIAKQVRRRELEDDEAEVLQDAEGALMQKLKKVSNELSDCTDRQNELLTVQVIAQLAVAIREVRSIM